MAVCTFCWAGRGSGIDEVVWRVAKIRRCGRGEIRQETNLNDCREHHLQACKNAGDERWDCEQPLKETGL